MKTYIIEITEQYIGSMEVEAESAEQAREQVWKDMETTDMGDVMDTSDGFVIKSIKEKTNEQ